MPTLLILLCSCAAAAPPVFLEDRFELPPGFRIYKAAGPELSGGSYDICFDARGRLLVGDGTRIRRLEDRDGDGVFDAQEVIATGLGPRGPQGICVVGDNLYAVGGDGIQLFTGYSSGGELVPRGRLGAPFSTGGDHDAHEIFRGHDGWLYFITGNGGGAKDRKHITEASSPALFERECSVFRFTPDGARWECVGSGGRNAPNLGMNYLGDLFSLDSDMEWHVDLPWWRPVRLHHWIQGGDQGWQDVGAYPPYYVDNTPGILDVGRGSPCWGVFYEHTQLPEKYRDAYLVCDYLSKSATSGGYETTGRLFAFFLTRDGAGWKATSEVLARPKPGAKDADGRPISFALVDIEVAPDGSLFLSDHNQGVWRIIHDPSRQPTSNGALPIFPAWPQLAPATVRGKLVDELLALPQPASEWSRAREEEISKLLGESTNDSLKQILLDKAQPLPRRLRASRLLQSRPARLDDADFGRLARDAAPEIREQTVRLLGPVAVGKLPGESFIALLADSDPLVRRCTLELVARNPGPGLVPFVIAHLSDPVRLVRYTAMMTLSHFPTSSWFEQATAGKSAQALVRALVAADLRREPPPDEAVRKIVSLLIADASPGDSTENRLDLLRVLGRFHKTLRADAATAQAVAKHLLFGFPDPDADIGREQVRLLGEYGVRAAFGKLVSLLEDEKNPVAQFHIAQALSRVPSGWAPEEEERAWKWLLGTQRGWFADFAGKGLQFPDFWLTVLAEFASHHRDAILRHAGEVDLSSQLGGITIDVIADAPDALAKLTAMYRGKEDPRSRRRIASALGGVKDEKAGAFLREEYFRVTDTEMRGAILKALARQPANPASRPIFEEGLIHPDRDVVGASVRALASYKLEPDERAAGLLLAPFLTRIELFHPIERLLMAASGKKRPGFDPDADAGRRPSDGEIESGSVFWKSWYEDSFGHPFDPASVSGAAELSDEKLRAIIADGAPAGGDAGRGKSVFIEARCATCHGGVAAPGSAERLFGPELSGVTRRLTRAELADSIVYPSKTVADRFKGVFLQLGDGTTLTGFITERTDDSVTLVDPDRVHRISPKDIALTAPLETSLMPERLLNRLSLDQVRDLLVFLDAVGAQPDATAPAKNAGADDWPCWRGPGGRGVAAGPVAPERWSPTENIAWQAALEGWGDSSPAVTSDRVYVTTQTDDDKLHAFALDRATGAVVWNKVLGSGRKKAHELHNMATPSPAAEESRVWVLFGTGDLACLDREGKVLWQRNLEKEHGEYRILWGMGSSPMLHGGLLYTLCSHSGPSYVLAIDKETGRDVWKAQRDLPCVAEATDSYSSPVFAETRGRVELVVGARDHVNAYDPLTGNQLWISSGLKIAHDYGRTMASPGVGDGIVVACSASVQGLGKMIAVRSGGEGDVTTSRLWQYEKFTPDCPSPLCYAGRVYVVRDDGIASCLDATTGELRWKKRLAGGNFKASPVACAGKVYFLGMDGDCTVQRAGTNDEVIAENHLDGRFIATPAISRGHVYFRSKDRVYDVRSP